MYQVGWYSPYHHDLVINSSPFNWFGPLVGFVDASLPISSMDKMIIRIKTSTFDYYIHFNRASGMNAQTTTAPNKVLITQRPTGTTYSDSYFLAVLSNPGSTTFTIPFFNGSSNTLTIQLLGVTTGPGPWRAWVWINF
jgi:hypothetical protein